VKLFYHIRVALWICILSRHSIRKAWLHSGDAMIGYDGGWTPKRLAENYIKHWGIE